MTNKKTQPTPSLGIDSRVYKNGETEEMKIEAKPFDELRADFNNALQRTLGAMAKQDVDEAKITINVTLSLTEYESPRTPDGTSYIAKLPQIGYDITRTIQTKDKTAGKYDNADYELAADGNGGFYLRKKVFGQMNVFDMDAEIVQSEDDGEVVYDDFEDGQQAIENTPELAALPAPAEAEQSEDKPQPLTREQAIKQALIGVHAPLTESDEQRIYELAQQGIKASALGEVLRKAYKGGWACDGLFVDYMRKNILMRDRSGEIDFGITWTQAANNILKYIESGEFPRNAAQSPKNAPVSDETPQDGKVDAATEENAQNADFDGNNIDFDDWLESQPEGTSVQGGGIDERTLDEIKADGDFIPVSEAERKPEGITDMGALPSYMEQQETLRGLFKRTFIQHTPLDMKKRFKEKWDSLQGETHAKKMKAFTAFCQLEYGEGGWSVDGDTADFGAQGAVINCAGTYGATKLCWRAVAEQIREYIDAGIYITSAELAADNAQPTEQTMSHITTEGVRND